MAKQAGKKLSANKLGAILRRLDAGEGDNKIAKAIPGITRHDVRKIAAERAGRAAGTAPPAEIQVPIELINVGKRVRCNYGDIASLARSIEANGLLHPVVVRKGEMGPNPRGSLHPRVLFYDLIAGERRLRAWQLSKFRNDPIPIRVIDLASLMRGEFAENHERKDFTPSETVAIKRALEIEFDLKDEAKARKRDALRQGNREGRKAPERGRAIEVVAAYAGKGARTIEKATKVVEAAERDPARFGPIKEQMDRSGKVDGPARRVANMLAGDKLRAEPYRTIVIDPPWPADLNGWRDNDARGYYPYKTMTLEQIAAMEVGGLAHLDGCALWLWIPNFHLVRGCQLPLLKAWGFEGSTLLTWCKPRIGHGQRLRGASEQCILAVRGAVPILGGAVKTWFEAPGGEDHSAKPRQFFEIVEAVTPAPRYASLFAGKDRRDLWDMHGDRIGVGPNEPTPITDADLKKFWADADREQKALRQLDLEDAINHAASVE